MSYQHIHPSGIQQWLRPCGPATRTKATGRRRRSSCSSTSASWSPSPWRRRCTTPSPTGTRATASSATSLVFFAIWWAWMNFTWFASAYDTDDVPYRLVSVRPDGRRADPRRRHPACLRRPRLHRRGRRLRRDAPGAWSPSGCGRRPAPTRRGAPRALRYAIGITVCRSAGSRCSSLPDAVRRRFVVLGVAASCSFPSGPSAVGTTPWHPQPHRRALRPVHDHRAGRVGARGDVAIQTAIDAGHARRRSRTLTAGGLLSCSRCGGSTSTTRSRSC